MVKMLIYHIVIIAIISLVVFLINGSISAALLVGFVLFLASLRSLFHYHQILDRNNKSKK